MDEMILQSRLREVLSPERADGLDCSVTLYRYAAGDLSPDEVTELRGHLARCARCRADLLVFRNSERPPSRGWVPRAIAWLRLRRLAAAATLLFVAVVGGTLWWASSPGGGHRPVVALRAKSGAAALHVAVQRGERSFAADASTRFEDGDTLGFFYSAPTETWPVVLFVDGAGSVARIFPLDTPVLLPAGADLRLAAGAVVQPGQGCEWIVAIFFPKSQPPDLPASESMLRAKAQARAPADASCDLKLSPDPGASVSVFVVKRPQ